MDRVSADKKSKLKIKTGSCGLSYYPQYVRMVSFSSLSRGVMGNSDSVCSVAHAAGRVGGGVRSVGA